MTGPQHRMPGVVYQDADRLAHYLAEGVLTEETLPGAFREVARKHADRTALSEPGWTCTYAEFDQLTDRAGAAFLRLGLKPLDRVIFQISNSRQLMIAFFGCLKAGLIPVCTLAAHRRIEIGYLGRHSNARLHLVHGDDARHDMVGFAQEMRSEVPSLEHTVVARGAAPDLPGFHSFDALIEDMSLEQARAALAKVDIDPFQVALFQLSGGTSGVPKIIPEFHNEYLYSLRTVIARHSFDEHIVAFTPNPFMHNAPMLCYFGAALYSGGEVAIAPKLDPCDDRSNSGRQASKFPGDPNADTPEIEGSGLVGED